MNIPIEKRIIATEIAVIREKKKTRDFQEEKLLNHIMYACRQWLIYKEKADGRSSSN